MAASSRHSDLPATFIEAIAGKQDWLVTKMDTESSGLLVKLLARKVITDSQFRAIENNYSGERRTEMLLEILCKRADTLLPVFCQALVETGQEHVAVKLGYQGETGHHLPELPVPEGLPATFSAAFAGKQDRLVRRIDTEHSGLLMKLLAFGVISERQHRAIESCSGDSRNMMMLDILSRFTDDSLLPVFCQALVESDHAHVAQMLGYTDETGHRRQPSELPVPEVNQNSQTPKRDASESLDNSTAAVPMETEAVEQSSPPVVHASFASPSDGSEASSSSHPVQPTHVKYSELTDVEVIGEGGFGVVYRAVHHKWGTVVYKELKSTFIKDGSKAAVELQQEAKSHVLNHVNIVKLYATVFEPRHYGVVLEFVPHGGLDEYLFQNKPVDWSNKLYLAHGVVCGMEYLHSIQPHPVIHGDLKVQNVLVGDRLVAKICDFGLAKWKAYSQTHTASRSKRGGTVTHTPPEMWQDINHPRTVKYDVYSFAVLLWELITEEQPYKQGRMVPSYDQIKAAVMMGQRPDLNAVIGPEMPVTLINDCISRCWHQLPESRPSFADLNQEFTRIREISEGNR